MMLLPRWLFNAMAAIRLLDSGRIAGPLLTNSS